MVNLGACPAPFALPFEFVKQMQRANDLFEIGDQAQKLGQDDLPPISHPLITGVSRFWFCFEIISQPS
jgi:hypothetical protein